MSQEAELPLGAPAQRRRSLILAITGLGLLFLLQGIWIARNWAPNPGGGSPQHPPPRPAQPAIGNETTPNPATYAGPPQGPSRTPPPLVLRTSEPPPVAPRGGKDAKPHQGKETLSSMDLIFGLPYLERDRRVALSATQARTLLELVKQGETIHRDSWPDSGSVALIFTPAQRHFLDQHREELSKLASRAVPGSMDPDSVTRRVLALLEERSGNARAVPLESSPDRKEIRGIDSREFYPGILALEGERSLAINPSQAATLLLVVRQSQEAAIKNRQVDRQMFETMTDEQLQFLFDLKNRLIAQGRPLRTDRPEEVRRFLEKKAAVVPER